MTVRCADCGFLAIRNCETRELVEVELSVRNGEGFPSEQVPPSEERTIAGLQQRLGIVSAKRIYEDNAICFMREPSVSRDFQHAADSAKKDRNYHGHFLRVINEERCCERFTPWTQGLTPREHREMLDQKQLLAYQKEREDSDRQWRQSQAQQDYVWRRDEARWRRIELVVMGIIVTLVTVVTNVVCAFIQRGDWPKSN
ncbi:MAG: hypothetical protein FD138_3960 [Planctomycetota bacterium]|nr:MAG: hypothetical protein FD138_3960 [Planctomycetota bacterium]